MKTSGKILLLLSLTLVLAAAPYANAQLTIDEVEASIKEAYDALARISVSVETKSLIGQLNQAINITEDAKTLLESNPQQVPFLLARAKAITQNVTVQAGTSKDGTPNELVMVGAIVSVLTVSGMLICLRGPDLFWKIWLRLRRNYKVRAHVPAEKGRRLVISPNHVCTAVFAITIGFSCFLISPYFLPNETLKPFSDFSVLGPNMQLGNYPSSVVSNQSMDLYGYVGNRMGRPMYYDVRVKIGNNETYVNPASTEVVNHYSSIVASNETWIFPLKLTLLKPGDNQRIIFELWIYNESSSQFQYHKRWCQVWLNVTESVL